MTDTSPSSFSPPLPHPALQIPVPGRTGRPLSELPRYDDTVRWPIWKTSLLILGVCGAFWASVIYLALQVFG